MTSPKTLFFSSFLVFCTAVLSGSYLNGDKNNYGNLNSSVREKIFNSHKSDLTQASKNWENIQQNINEVNNLITNSTKSLTQEESRKNELTQKEKDNDRKIKELNNYISNLDKAILSWNSRKGINYQRAQNIFNARNLSTLNVEIEVLKKTNSYTQDQIKELVGKFLELRKIWAWYVKNRTVNNRKANNRTTLKEKLEEDIKTSKDNLERAKNNLKITKNLIEEWTKILKTYDQNLKNLSKEEQKLLLQLKSIFSKISKI